MRLPLSRVMVSLALLVLVQNSAAAQDAGAQGYPGGPPSNSNVCQLARAQWGAGHRRVDVTQRVQSMARGDQLNFKVNNTNLGGDPAPDQKKTLSLYLPGLARARQHLPLPRRRLRKHAGGRQRLLSQSARAERYLGSRIPELERCRSRERDDHQWESFLQGEYHEPGVIRHRASTKNYPCHGSIRAVKRVVLGEKGITSTCLERRRHPTLQTPCICSRVRLKTKQKTSRNP